MKVLSNLGLIGFVLWIIDTEIKEENIELLSFTELNSLCPEELSCEQQCYIIEEQHQYYTLNIMLQK